MKQSKYTKRALLTSVLAIVLCCAMLIGTTFAWFTDTASTAVNKIQAGTLDVVLEMKEDGEWVDAEGETLEFVKAADAPDDEAILWEPGCTYKLPELRIRNNGNLALKYKIIISGINGDAKLNEAIEWKVQVGNSIGPVDTYEGKLKADGSSDALVISGHMKESAGNEYQGLFIDGVAITVIATQHTYEHDSNDDQYDASAEYPEVVKDAQSAADAIVGAKDGDVIVLTEDMDLNKAIDENGNAYDSSNRLVLSANNVTIDLNGNDLTVFNHTLTITGDNVTIKNGTIIATTANQSQTYGSYAVAVGGKNVTLENLTTTGGISVNGYSEHADEKAVTHSGASAIITNCNITNTNYYAVCAQGEASAYVSNCTLNCESGTNTFWVEKAYTKDDLSVGDSSLTYETDTVTITGNLELYNPGGLAPIEK